MFTELLPLSAIAHLVFCERRAALVHLEQLWAENYFTVDGQHFHQKAHEGRGETREGVRVVRGLHLQSRRLGLVGKADVVEFAPPTAAALTNMFKVVRAQYMRTGSGQRKQGSAELNSTQAESDHTNAPDTRKTPLAGWTITPVEYKRGRPKANECDRAQLCAQAICLEEMLDVEIERGFLFYGQRRRRLEVAFDAPLRATTTEAAARLHDMIDSRKTPQAEREKKCDGCSLLDLCLPAATSPRRSAARFAGRQFAACVKSEGPVSDFAES